MMTKMPTDYYWLVLWDYAVFLVIATLSGWRSGPRKKKESLPAGSSYLTLICVPILLYLTTLIGALVKKKTLIGAYY
jgi:hypothetical protein